MMSAGTGKASLVCASAAAEKPRQTTNAAKRSSLARKGGLDGSPTFRCRDVTRITRHFGVLTQIHAAAVEVCRSERCCLMTKR